MKNKKHKNWCSKHQRVHEEGNIHQSCKFPNIADANEKDIQYAKAQAHYKPFPIPETNKLNEINELTKVLEKFSIFDPDEGWKPIAKAILAAGWKKEKNE